MKPVSEIRRRARASVLRLIRDRRGLAAVEFAMIVPIMLVLFFGTVEFSSGIAIDRKVTLLARTMSDLTSQSPTLGVSDADFTSFFQASQAIMTPYSTTPLKIVISELYVDPTTHKARVEWSKGYQGGAVRATKSAYALPAALAVDGSYLILSEVSYLYTPTVGYVMSKAGITLSHVAYTRPRQYNCVYYPEATSGNPTCPTS
ncbi:TadE/TadG family type IV pilus assembly protein [Bradyrhizobium sp. dw_78]|uniref:TadE/TadG family type IV pilus assembly protein n=1 Tax=Bradyrhizobium sp. dw_78 TaxID=2719793 RepID=UPI001BD21C1B|nr:TadE/TadG family type IV pilus assembly protein [Bradyrhizobium sp. dw_78]